MAGTVFAPNLDDYWRFVHQATWQNDGEDFEESLGDVESAGATMNFTDIERNTKEYALITLAKIDTIGVGVTVNLKTMSLTRNVASVFFGDNSAEKFIQAAETITKTFANVKVGRIYNIGARDAEITSADDGSVTPKTFVEGTHYTFHPRTGRIQVIAIPSGATQLVVEADVPAITEAADIAVYGGMNSNGKIGTLRFYGVSNIGQNFKIEFYKGRLRSPNEIAFQAGEEYSSADLELRVLGDGTKPERFRYFRVEEI